MNVKTETVRFMAGSTFLDKIFHSLLGRVFIAALQTTLSSVVLLLMLLLRQTVDILPLRYALVVGIGLIAGFSARRFLKSNTQILKLFVALSSITLSLAILFLLSGGFLGINLYYQLNEAPDWGSLIQFGLAALCAWLVINAFTTPHEIEDIPVPTPPLGESSPLSKPGINLWPPKLTLPSGKKISEKLSRGVVENKEPFSVGKSTSQIDPPSRVPRKSPKKVSPPHKLSLTPVPRPEIKKPTRLKKKRAKKKPANAKEIKLIGAAEHNCPYCLDPVEHHDPRGVKICSICKTHHHADCWGITGACQIPHSQE